MNLPFDKIPDPPTDKSATSIIARMVDGLGFRYRWATEGLTEKEFEFRPTESSMNMKELLIHLYNLAYTANNVFGGSMEKKRNLETLNELREETVQLYADLGKRLKSMDDSELEKSNFFRPKSGSEFPFWYLLNGQIADAHTHVGQVTSWRRIAGNPQPEGVNVFLGTKV